MAGRLQDKVAVVTGGSSGIGEGMVRRFCSEGASVLLADIDEPNGAMIAAECGAEFIMLDVSEPDSWQQLQGTISDKYGRLDTLVNNAGMVRTSRVMKTDVRVWEEHLKVNLTGSFLCALKVLPGMVSRGRGRIINVASIAAVRGLPYLAAYCASKHGLIGFTRALATEVGDKGVNVHALSPDRIQDMRSGRRPSTM